MKYKHNTSDFLIAKFNAEFIPSLTSLNFHMLAISFLKFSSFMDPKKPETTRAPETPKATLFLHVFLNDLSPFIFF